MWFSYGLFIVCWCSCVVLIGLNVIVIFVVGEYLMFLWFFLGEGIKVSGMVVCFDVLYDFGVVCLGILG